MDTLTVLRKDFSRNSSIRSRIVCLIVRFRKNKYCHWIFRFINLLFVVLPYGIEIECGENIGAGMRLPHLSGIIIHDTAIIGEDVTIFQQVTIGVNEHDKYKSRRAAIIGKNVYIGAGAKVIGNVRIGDNVRIGANAVVCKDIPDNCTVVGSNKIIRHKFYV